MIILGSWESAQLIDFTTSSVLTAVNTANDGVTRRGTSYVDVAAVDVRVVTGTRKFDRGLCTA